MATHVSLWLAFGAGILSFISPCTLPLFPSYLGYISGVSMASPPHSTGNLTGNPADASAARTAERRLRALAHAFWFCLGLSSLFVMLGFGASFVGSLLLAYRSEVRMFGGILVIVMGLFMAGVFRNGWLLRERRVRLPRTKALGYAGSFLVGVAFAAGWTPCIGPILAAMLTMTIAHPENGKWLMMAYAVGFSIPFLVLAATLTSLRGLLPYTERIARIGGWLLVIMGVLLLTDKMATITLWIQQTTGFSGF